MKTEIYRGFRIERCQYGPGYAFEALNDPEACGIAPTVADAREDIDERILLAEDEAARRAEARA